MSDRATEYLPRPGEFDPLAGESTPGDAGNNGGRAAHGQRPADKRAKPMLEVWTPSALKNYVPPADQCLVGDFHLQRGAPSVLAGPPGCGKSRATLWLGILGARGMGEWFGLPVHTQFRTMIVQSENGLTRLHRDFEQISDVEHLDDWMRITAFPAYRGFEFANPYFRNELKAALRDFRPQVVVLDPWNNITRDAMEKDFLEAFERVREVLAEAPDAACLIIHHLRKPRAEDRHRGRSLANLLSGSYVLVSMARSVLVMQPASDDTEDSRIVFTPAKNNDGQLGARSPWVRKAGWFEAVPDFDLEEFDCGHSKREPKVTEAHLRQVFDDGRKRSALKWAADQLQEIAEVGRSAAYEALRLEGGRFSHLLETKDKLIGLRVEADGADDGPIL